METYSNQEKQNTWNNAHLITKSEQKWHVEFKQQKKKSKTTSIRVM